MALTRRQRRRIWLQRHRDQMGLERMYRRLMRRFFDRVKVRVLANIQRGLRPGLTMAAALNPPLRLKAAEDNVFIFDIEEIADELETLVGPAMFETIAAGGVVGLADAASDLIYEPNAEIVRFVNKNKIIFSDREVVSMERAVRRELGRGIAADESVPQISRRISGLFNENFKKFRADRIAQTEVSGAYHFGIQNSYERVGIQAKQWLTSQRPNVRPSHQTMEGQIVALGESFITGDGNSMQFPGDPNAPVGERVNENCTMTGVQAPDAGKPEAS